MINSMNFIFSIRTDYFLTNMCLEYLLDMFLPVPSFIVEGFPPPPLSLIVKKRDIFSVLAQNRLRDA